MKNSIQIVSGASFIFASITMIIMLFSFTVKADSSSCFKLVYKNASTSNLSDKELTKFVSTGIKSCKKTESQAKKRLKLESMIKKLQLKLTKDV